MDEDSRGAVPGASTDGETRPLLDTKKKKKDKKKNAVDIGTSMQLERTFFKWIWLGLHIGGVGTFILAFFGKSGHTGIAEVVLVCITWTLAFSFVIFGVYNYYRRRHALAAGLDDRFYWDNPRGPYLAVAAVVFELVLVIGYAAVVNY